MFEHKDEMEPPSSEEADILMMNLVLSEDMGEAVEKATRGQADCKLWHDMHNGRLTSSRFGEIFIAV